MSSDIDVQAQLDRVRQASQAGKLTPAAVTNIQRWLTESRYRPYLDSLIEHIDQEKWQVLDDVFWTVIPFGTGGRRGMMYPIGSNAINDRTIGESAQGLADYVKQVKPDGPWSFGIAYDTRHRSREFAELCAGIMVANGFEVYFIDDYRSTPELSFLIRHQHCDCGIMVTASHNPPSDNAVKVYWSDGAQLTPPHDQAVIDRVAEVQDIDVADFQHGVAQGKIHLIKEAIDEALKKEHLQQTFAGPRDVSVIYSPLHGVGEFNVKSTLEAAGFSQLEIYEPHREPNGDFPNVPGHVSNPENAEVFDAIIERAQQTGADLILATDPDCDRMGAAAPLTSDPAGDWATFNGNQLAVLLGEYILRKRSEAGTLTPEHFVVTTLVTTQMLRRVCESFQVRCFDENLVGFKWIAKVIDQQGPDRFVYGTEESHGFLVGQYCRDKDGAVACMLMAELAAEVKSRGQSLHEHLDTLYDRYGYHRERLVTIRMAGSDGMKRMERLMAEFRARAPRHLGGLEVTAVRDYDAGTRTLADGTVEAMGGPTGNVLIFETNQPGNYVAARPSGTEPKIKFYMFSHVSPEAGGDRQHQADSMGQRLDAFASDMQAFADALPNEA